MNMKGIIAGCLLSSILFTSAANASWVNAGSDYFETMRGTSFDFGGPIGIVQFIGVPIDPINLGTTDTIVKRLEDAEVEQPGDWDIINIEMQALSLQSVSPILLGGNWFNVMAGLDSANPSLGQMLINHENPDDQNLNFAEGTFDSMMNLNLEITFQDVNGIVANDFSMNLGNLEISSVGTCWSHTMTGKPTFPDESNFFIAKCPSDLGVGITTEAFLNGGPNPTVVDNPLTTHFPGGGLPPLVPGTIKVVLTPFPVSFEEIIDGGSLKHCIRTARAGLTVGPACRNLLEDNPRKFCGPGGCGGGVPEKPVLIVPEPPILFLLIPALLGLFATRKLAAPQ